jgi:two-component system chemotaxis response regulator CheV
MATLSNILLDKEILLESGTNELEVLVFDVADYRFGINVAKVREVLPATEITALPRAHRSIRGVFKLRNQVIPCVSLLDHLGIKPTREHPESTMILTDLNQQQTAFLVDAVERIHRLSWENILPVPGLEALSHTPVTALARCEDRLILMLDFEMILDDVTEQYFRTDEVANPLGLARETLRLLLAEDSPTVREAIGDTLHASGYVQLQFFENGAQAWEWIEGRYRETGRVEDVGDLLIADVEMPQVDGLHLTKRIKDHPELKRIPVLLYSSIITPDNRKKGSAVGADAQVAKPELTEVVRLADELIAKARRENRAIGLQDIARTCDAQGTASTSPGPASPAAGPPAGQRLPEPSPAPAAAATEAAPPHAAGMRLPKGVNRKLWSAFDRELTDRTARLREFLQRAQRGDCNEGVFREVARTLHTVKSASMVVPVDPITRCTHLAESLLEPARDDRGKWPHEALWRYADWLESLTLPGADVDSALAAGATLEAELSAQVKQ